MNCCFISKSLADVSLGAKLSTQELGSDVVAGDVEAAEGALDDQSPAQAARIWDFCSLESSTSPKMSGSACSSSAEVSTTCLKADTDQPASTALLMMLACRPSASKTDCKDMAVGRLTCECEPRRLRGETG